MSVTVGILGASGYAGAELLRLLAAHPHLRVGWAAGEASASQPLAARYPGLAAAYADLAFSTLDEGLAKGAEVLFCALPHGRAAELADRAAGAAEVVIDLSADFRLHDQTAYPAWYGSAHPHPEQLGAWPYGLPELHREALRGARRVAVPGCYPTAALLALAPLLRAGVIAPDGIVVDAKSGLSGAGRSLTDPNLFVQANESVTPYKVGTHRHTPEIEQELAALAGRPVTVGFTPHLVPMSRGILATCYAPHAGGDPTEALAAAYAGEPFVDVLTGAWPATRSVTGSNRAHVAAAVDARAARVVAAAAIDNLVKGAAGQAVQCANLALGLDETAGLDLVPPGP